MLDRLIDNMSKTDGRAFLTIGLFCLAAYSFMLASPFKTTDDFPSIVINKDIRSFENLPKVFKNGYFFKGDDYYRPLVTTSYMLEFHFFGLQPFFYNLDNLILHLFNSFLVFLLAMYFLRIRAQAFAVGLLFGLHPIQWEAVCNIAGRAILLSAFFSLCGFLLFLKFRKERRSWTLWLSAACYALSILSKESGGVLILVLVCYLYFFERNEIRQVRVRMRVLIPFFLVIFIYVMVRVLLNLIGVLSVQHANVMEVFLSFLTFLRGVLTYGRLFFWPEGLYFERSMAMYTTVLDYHVWAVMLVYGAGLIFLWRWQKRISPLFMFCLFWFFLELLPVSQILVPVMVQSGRISLAEHFLYVASVPVFVCVVSLVMSGVRKLNQSILISGTALGIIGASFLGYLFLMTVRQSMFASNEFIMIRDSLRRDRQNSQLQYSMGLIYEFGNNFTLAEKYFREAVRLQPRFRHRMALARILYGQGRILESVKEYEQIIPTSQDDAEMLDRYKKEAYHALTVQHGNKAVSGDRWDRP